MKKNYIKIAYAICVLLFLLACRVEDYSQIDSTNEYTSKSLWKEDRKYIENIINIYQENELEIRRGNGKPLWNYAMTMDHFDESYLIVPLVQSKKVVSLLQVPRRDDKVFFLYSQDPDAITFFQGLIDSKAKKVEVNSNAQISAKIVCTTRTISIWYPDDESDPNGSGHWGTRSITTCSTAPDDNCIVVMNESCGGELGGADTGYNYGSSGGPPSNNTDPCAKIKTNFADSKFKEKYDKINKPEVFDLDHEKGSFERYPPKNSGLQPAFVDVENYIGTTNMDLPADKSGIVGLMHSHNNEDANGNHPIKIFSPTDVRTFINHLMPQANGYTGSYTNAYSVVTTSLGNYMLQYTKSTWPGSINGETKDKWQAWYEEKYSELTFDELSDSSIVEKIFTQFIKEVVKIEGLEVYRVSETSSSKLEYDGKNNPVKSIPCP